ncbi:MAG: ABC transporter ATP-binding protein [Lachnospiraceae bacterium]|nr:ABC transporter ATP-binding protein [Lachnospiraceae bacterium]
MGKIFKNLIPYWKSVLVIFILLVVQAYCDLELPQLTSNIIDTGIINGGVEHIMPQQVTKETYDMLSYMMDENEKQIWEESYSFRDGIYYLSDYSEDELEQLDSDMLIPITLAYQLQNMQNSDAAGMSEMTDIPALPSENADGEIPMDQIQQMILQARAGVEKMVETTGENTTKSMALQFTRSCQQEAGMEVDSIQIRYLLMAGLKMLAMALLMAAAALLVGLFASRVGADIGRKLRNKVFEKVIGFSNAEIDSFSTASLITRSTNDIQQVQMFTIMMLRMVLYAPIIGVGGVVKVINTQSGMGWIIVVAVVCLLCLIGFLVTVAMPKFQIMQVLVDRLNLVSREILTGLSVIRAFGREKKEEERFDVANQDLMKTQLFTNRVMAVMMPGMMIIMNGTSILITWVAAKKIDLGTMQVGAMTAFIIYAMQIVMSFLFLTMLSIMLPRAGVAADRIDEVLKTPLSLTDKPDAKDFHVGEGIVRYEKVSFAYPNAKTDVLENISFTARPGEITAIIGSTGCGKSTLVNLLPRFYDVKEGSVTIDGVDIRDIKMEDLRESIGFVPQKGVLFSGTIASNLRFGKHDATEEEIKEAASIAQALDFVEEKKDGFDSAIAQGGSNVSGGQRQRLAIARAIVKKPKIMVFDDSFSALDMKTDAALRKALADKIKDSTVLIVAQRISTIIHADQILVLDEGKIVGMGKHEDLLKNCEVYEQIAKSQLSAKELGLNEKEAAL